MFGFLARLVGGAFDPLIDRVSMAGARLLRKLALFLVAAVCLVVVLIALTIAFDLWVASKLGAIAGALAVAGVYLSVAVIALVLALRGGSAPQAAATVDKAAAEAGAATASSRKEQVDAFAAPLMSALAGLGLRREQLAVLAGSSLAKQLGPLPLVGLAIVGGFLVGRMWKGWRGLMSMDALTSLLAAVGLFGAGNGPDAGDQADAED